MSIKSDRWIRRMAKEHGMIEPFEPGQVREQGGERIVSFGTSSYGYDVRCADEFKVFTNINRVSSISRVMFVSSRQTLSRWREPSSFFVFRAQC